jgi:hypothetical protein
MISQPSFNWNRFAFNLPRTQLWDGARSSGDNWGQRSSLAVVKAMPEGAMQRRASSRLSLLTGSRSMSPFKRQTQVSWWGRDLWHLMTVLELKRFPHRRLSREGIAEPVDLTAVNHTK